jgi:predicted phosphoadenosine phosphosulfate sulfurtransferase
MKIYNKKNVLDASLERVRYFFDEFEEVVVAFSGGKDSTVTLNLALMVAEEKRRLPLKVMFIDQEAEWNTVIDYMKNVMYDKRIEPYWFQIPIILCNSTSADDDWLHCWNENEKEKWIREKDPISKKENIYGTDRFKELFGKIISVEFANKKTCTLGGVRCQESPSRQLGLTSQATYKHITYGKILNKGKEHYTFYPIYDWTIQDVWKFIFDFKLEYCKHYDNMYSYGVALNDMRVSNVHHETAVKNLFMVQEIDPSLWSKLTKRLKGINTAGTLKFDSIKCPKELPYMFDSWKEYRDFLLENLITNNDIKNKFISEFKKDEAIYVDKLISIHYSKSAIAAILTNDPYTKLENIRTRPDYHGYRKFKKGIRHDSDKTNKFIMDIQNE